MKDGTYIAQVENDEPVCYQPFSGLSTLRRFALEQAVVWANATASVDRKSPAQVVAAATEFEAFLNGPEPAAE